MAILNPRTFSPTVKPRLTTASVPGGRRTELWRIFSYCAGDAHADRICKLLDAYCFLFRIPVRAFWKFPGAPYRNGTVSPIREGR